MNCYLLAGGRSTRMGRSKLDLEIGGATFLARVRAVAREAFDDVRAVQRPGGETIDGLPTIREAPHDDEAPIFGVLAALRHASRKCFILAVDYPLMSADLLRFLCERGEQAKAPLVVPRWDGKLQMLCAVWSPELRPLVALRIAERRYDLRAFASEAEVIDEAELRARFGGEPLMNVNTPEELESAARLI